MCIYMGVCLSLSLSLYICIYSVCLYVKETIILGACFWPRRGANRKRDRWGQNSWGHCKFHVFVGRLGKKVSPGTFGNIKVG